MNIAEAGALARTVASMDKSRKWIVCPTITDSSCYVTDSNRQIRYDYPWQFILEVMINIAAGNIHGTTTPNT